MPISTKEAAALLEGDKLRTIQRHVSDGKLKLSDMTRFQDYAKAQGWQLKDDTKQQETTPEPPKESITPSYSPPPGYILMDAKTHDRILEQIDSLTKTQKLLIEKGLNLKELPATSTTNDTPTSRKEATVDTMVDMAQDGGESGGGDAKIVINDVTSARVPKKNKKALKWILGACIFVIIAGLVVIFLEFQGIINIR